jgi:hypothetical protein
MKKILTIAAVLLLVTAIDADAQIEAYFGAGAGYNSEVEATSLRFYGGVPAGDFFTYFVDGGIYFRDAPRAGDVNANLRFMIPGSDVFRPYIYTGINYTRFGDDYIGANFGAGAQFMAGPVSSSSAVSTPWRSQYGFGQRRRDLYLPPPQNDAGYTENYMAARELPPIPKASKYSLSVMVMRPECIKIASNIFFINISN